MFTSRKQRMTDLIIQAAIQGQVISDALTAALGSVPAGPTAPFALPKFYSFQNPDQTLLLHAGGTGTIWSLTVPAGQVAWMRKLAINPMYLGDLISWTIDNVAVYPSGIQWQIGSVDMPVPVLKKAYKSIKFQGFNNDPSGEDHNYEIFGDGLIANLADESTIDRLIATGVL
jgi:hypothetical protein